MNKRYRFVITYFNGDKDTGKMTHDELVWTLELMTIALKYSPDDENRAVDFYWKELDA